MHNQPMNESQLRQLNKLAETLDEMQCAWQNKQHDTLVTLTQKLMIQQEMFEMNGKTILDLAHSIQPKYDNSPNPPTLTIT